MSRKLLSLLVKGALLIFFGVCLSVVLFFANGYSFDFAGQIIRKTGLIQIEYRDAEAKVSLDGEVLNGRLPFVISGVLPGIHHLKIEKTDFATWEKEIEVKGDLISRVEGVFLLPDDEQENLTMLLEAYVDTYKTFFVDGYLVLVSSDQIRYGLLSKDIGWANLKVKNLPFESVLINKNDYYDHFVRFDLTDGRVMIFDLLAGEWLNKSVQSGFTYYGDNWFYLKDKLFAIYDKDLARLIQANRFEKVYDKFSYENFGGKEWFLMFGKAGYGDLYKKNGSEMELIADQVVDFLDGKVDKLLYVRNDFTLWEYSISTGKKQVLTRFSDGFKLLGSNFRINENFLGWFYKYDGKYWFADQDWDNNKSLVDRLNILEARFKNPGQIYLLSKETSLQNKEVQKLYLLNLEN